MTSGRMTRGQMTSGRMTSGQMTSGQITSSQMTSGQMTSGQMTSGQMTSSQMTSSQITSGQMTSGQMTSGHITSGQMTSGRGGVIFGGPGVAVGPDALLLLPTQSGPSLAQQHGHRGRKEHSTTNAGHDEATDRRTRQHQGAASEKWSNFRKIVTPLERIERINGSHLERMSSGETGALQGLRTPAERPQCLQENLAPRPARMLRTSNRKLHRPKQGR